MKHQSSLLLLKSLSNRYYSFKQALEPISLLLSSHRRNYSLLLSSNVFVVDKFCHSRAQFSNHKNISTDSNPTGKSFVTEKGATPTVAIMPAPSPKNKRKQDSKDNWYSNKQKKKLQKQQQQASSNLDDESSASSSGKNKYSRRALTDKEMSEQKPHPGSFACLDMRNLYGYPEVLNDDDIVDDGSSKLPKRKVVLLIAYLGQNYVGFQINEGQRTVQAELEYAFYKSGFLSIQNFGFPMKYGWATSARTDKGVHACAQVCNVKIRYSDSLGDVRDKINQYLPSDIVILDIVQTSKNFNAKTARNKVKYQYMLPSFVLQDSATLKDLFLQHTTTNPDTNGTKFSPLTSEEANKLYSIFKTYRASADQINNLKDALKSFEGTHCFHNYTRGRDYDDKSASRFIISFEVGETVISEQDGMEWVPTHVTGQSFLLNQIRKMISMAIDVARGFIITGTSTNFENRNDFIMESFSKNKMQIDIAPAQGLFLEMSYFDFYNQRSKGNKLDWSPSSATADSEAVARWKHFKEHMVLPQIMKEEGMDYNFINYMYIHEFRHSYYKIINNLQQQEQNTLEEAGDICNEKSSAYEG
jgi:tRNA pseudouridine38-40 synthase